MEIRLCRKEEKDLWMNLNRAYMEETLGKGQAYVLDLKRRGADTLSESFDKAMELSPIIQLLFFEHEGEVVGFVNINVIYRVWSNGRALIVDDFYIKPEARSKGFGQEGIVLVEKFAKDNGIKRIQFHGETDDPKVLQVWDDFGYHPTGQVFYMRHI